MPVNLFGNQVTSKSLKDKSGVPAQHAGRAAELGEYYKKAMVWLAVVYSIVLTRVPRTEVPRLERHHPLAPSSGWPRDESSSWKSGKDNFVDAAL